MGSDKKFELYSLGSGNLLLILSKEETLGRLFFFTLAIRWKMEMDERKPQRDRLLERSKQETMRH